MDDETELQHAASDDEGTEDDGDFDRKLDQSDHSESKETVEDDNDDDDNSEDEAIVKDIDGSGLDLVDDDVSSSVSATSVIDRSNNASSSRRCLVDAAEGN